MDKDLVIEVKNLSKAYRIWSTPVARMQGGLLKWAGNWFPLKSTIQRRLFQKAATLYRDFYALQDISFTVSRGESVGIIGRNGSGKSTLLQIIAGTLRPTGGSVKVKGRVAALLELGSGFNPEFTGRENVYLNAAVLGISRREADKRFDRIAAFADIGDFIDQPVKTYSSGMMVRLAFAVSINVSADIVIIDEALAVGDINFQAKCITALRKLQESGVCLILVTHGTDVVKGMCRLGMYLREGHLVAMGQGSQIADLYLKDMREQLSAEIARSQMPHTFPTVDISTLPVESGSRPEFRRDNSFQKRVASGRSGTGEATITAVELLDGNSSPTNAFQFGSDATIRVHLELNNDLEFLVGYHIRDERNLSILCSGTFTETGSVIRGHAGDCFVVDFETPLPLRHGRYYIAAQITTRYIRNQTAQFVDWAEPAAVFEMQPREPQIVWAAVYLKNQIRLWHIDA